MKALLTCLLLLTASLASVSRSESLPFVGGMPGSLEQTVTVGDLAYCATSCGLLVLDVSDPAAITQISWLPLPDGVWWAATGIAVAGDRACLAVWERGLVVVDIADPTAPAVLGVCDVPVSPGGVAVSGHYAYVADMSLGFCVIDIADPTAPFLAITLMHGEEYRGFAFADGMAYLGSDAGSFYLIDVADPLAPALAGSLGFPGYVRGIDVDGGLAYLACGSLGLRIIDVTDPGDLVELSQLRLKFGSSWEQFATEVAVTGGVAYVALSSRGLGLVDVGAPAAPFELSEHPVAGVVKGFERHGDRLHVAANNGGLAVLDLSSPTAPIDLGQHWLVGMALDVVARDGRIWVAGGWADTDEKSRWGEEYAGLFVVEDERVTGYCSTGLLPQAIVLSGDHAYLPAEYGGLRIQDVTDPTAPVEVAAIESAAEHSRPAVVGDRAYVLGYNQLEIYDVGDPAQPEMLGSCPVDDYGNLVAGHDVVYNVCGYPGLRVYDVRDAAVPAEIGWLDLPSGAQAGALVGDLLCVANGLNGLSVIDVADPSQPALVGACDLPGYARGVACRWPFAYVVADRFSDEPSGLYVVDISDPTDPVVVFSNEIPGTAMAVALDGPRVVVAARWDGVMVFRHDVVTGVAASRATLLRPNYPNPFNPRTTIGFEVPTATDANLAVFDVAGRRVRTLVDGRLTAGSRSVSWDGADDHGRAMSAGVYLYRLTACGERESRRMVLVR